MEIRKAIRETRSGTSLGAILLMVAGFVCGAGLMIFIYNRSAEERIFNQESANLVVILQALHHLRHSHTNEAIEFLESRLDGSIFTFQDYVARSEQIDKQPVLNSLRKVKAYRVTYAHTNRNPEIDAAVNAVLSHIP